MKKMLAFTIAAIMVVMMGTAVFAEEAPDKADEPFSFQETWNWDMNQDAVIEALGNIPVEVEQEMKMIFVDPEDDDNWKFEDILADVKFGIKDDLLGLICVSFDMDDPGVSDDAVFGALENLYGKGEEVTDTKIIEDLIAFAGSDELDDLLDHPEDLYTIWTLDNGTIVLLQKEMHEDDRDIDVMFFQEASLGQE